MTPTSTENATTNQRANVRPASNINVSVATPDAIKAILLSDGWHEVDDCELTHFAVAEGMSEPNPNSLYAGISYLDKKTGRAAVSSLKSIQAFEFDSIYSSQQRS